MSEGWEDWPVLGPGWKRRTAVRKSGASCGNTDTYYQSPTGERFRSKIEMSKYLGASIDLSLFDFKNGIIIPPEKRKKIQRRSLPAEKTVEPKAKKKRVSLPLPAVVEKEQNGTVEETLVRCQGCKVWFAGVEFGKAKLTSWHCSDCRASRRAFNKQQKFYKNAGCGTCTACQVTENCGYCTVCLLRSHNPEFGSSWKCVRRRCLQVIRKSEGCGACQGCQNVYDCDVCSVCIKRSQNPEMVINEKCLERRCISKMGFQLSESKSPGTKKQNAKKSSSNKQKPKSEKKSSQSQPHTGRRKNRKCGECESCLQKDDCGKCDFCQDKPKFGGRNLKRQKCRWRQCLRFAMEKNFPAFHRSSNHPALLERIKREGTDAEYMEQQPQDQGMHSISPLRGTVIKIERVEPSNGQYYSGNDLHSSPMGEMFTSRAIKQEMVESNVTHVQATEPENLQRVVKMEQEEFITESDDIAEADESTPVIMEIFSLGSYHASGGLDTVLQEFMGELNEIPLPAHWEVQAHTSPNLQLVQRSRLSTMADTVIHIQPGLLFHVVVRGQLVPSSHELYSNHPTRLTTVDDVVELICDLEAYRPCAGIHQPGLASPECLVLAYEERCEECCKMPWPSGSDH
ncbi:methyl-CpG-binding domain protein 1-like isoform 2-T2 [Rhinophrynus dorsalis]